MSNSRRSEGSQESKGGMDFVPGRDLGWRKGLDGLMFWSLYRKICWELWGGMEFVPRWDPKSVQNRSKIGAKSVQKSFGTAFGSDLAPKSVPRPIQIGSKTDFGPIFNPIWRPKSVQIRSKISFGTIGKAISKRTRFQARFGNDFWSILKPSGVHFWLTFKALPCKVIITPCMSEFFKKDEKPMFFHIFGYHG